MRVLRWAASAWKLWAGTALCCAYVASHPTPLWSGLMLLVIGFGWGSEAMALAHKVPRR
jgi:hypothetical protein